jgi:hypothetical protein
LPPDGSPSSRGGPRRRGVAGGIALCGITLCGIALAVAGAATFAPAGRSAAPQFAPGFPGGPYFALGCGFSHRNNDDAIVFAGQPGLSHNHTYIGNRSTTAATTPSSLLGGSTTCESDADTSTYWAPTLFEGTNAVHPLTGIVYYVKRTSEDVVPIPVGLKMVAGTATAKSRQPKGTVAWSCGGVGGKPRFAVVPQCEDDQLLQLQVNFPNCWNGKTLDSADHKRHLAYASRGRCRASHPVAVPTIALILLYPPVSRYALLSSGRFGAHADFMNGWDQEAFATLVAGLNIQ